MPLLVNKLIFSIVPSRAPFFIRPLLWMVFGQLDKQMLMPEIRKNRDLVGLFDTLLATPLVWVTYGLTCPPTSFENERQRTGLILPHSPVDRNPPQKMSLRLVRRWGAPDIRRLYDEFPAGGFRQSRGG